MFLFLWELHLNAHIVWSILKIPEHRPQIHHLQWLLQSKQRSTPHATIICAGGSLVLNPQTLENRLADSERELEPDLKQLGVVKAKGGRDVLLHHPRQKVVGQNQTVSPKWVPTGRSPVVPNRMQSSVCWSAQGPSLSRSPPYEACNWVHHEACRVSKVWWMSTPMGGGDTAVGAQVTWLKSLSGLFKVCVSTSHALNFLTRLAGTL